MYTGRDRLEYELCSAHHTSITQKHHAGPERHAAVKVEKGRGEKEGMRMWPVTLVYSGHVAFFPQTQLCPVGLGASTASSLQVFPFLLSIHHSIGV